MTINELKLVKKIRRKFEEEKYYTQWRRFGSKSGGDEEWLGRVRVEGR